MAEPKPSFALKHPFFLQAEYERRQFKNEYGSVDVFWIRLALRERELNENAQVDEKNIVAFQRELGEAIFNGGLSSGKRFEDARNCIRGEDRNQPPDDMEYFDAYFACCEKLQRLPTLPEVRRVFHDVKLKPGMKTKYKLEHEHGANPSEGELVELLDRNWKEMEADGIVGAGDFRKKCKSLGILFSNGNHLPMVRRLWRDLQSSNDYPATELQLLEKVSEKPSLKCYLLRNWSIEMFFWWWCEWAGDESGNLSEPKHAGLTYLTDSWDSYVQQWMERLTRDGAIPLRANSSFGRVFWELADKEKRPPSVPEMLIKISKEDLMEVLRDCWCVDDALEFLTSVRDELSAQCDKEEMEDLKVSDVQSLLEVVQPFQEIHAFQYSMSRLGFEVS